MREFLGGSGARGSADHFLTAGEAAGSRGILPSPATLADALDRGGEIRRPLWDEEALLAELDIEYVNFDAPGEVLDRPAVGFILQEPVVQQAAHLLAECGVPFLHCLSGRGHHFTWRIPVASGAFRQLVELGGEFVAGLRGEASGSETADGLPSSLCDAFFGLGLVIEYLAGETRRQIGHLCAVPVELTAVEAGSIGFGREVVSIDVSAYGDPLPFGTVRVPFSPSPRPHGTAAAEPAPLFVIPRGDFPLEEALQIMRDPVLVQRWARETSAVIPEGGDGTEHLIRRYRASTLFDFHRWYYSHHPQAPRDWPHTYDRLPLESLPPCARQVLEKPNDGLVRPWGMRLVTRVLLALGWHPRHIAGVIWSKFARDHGWGDAWCGHDPAMRADFYTRIFSGPFVARTDDLTDFNCQSSREQRDCPTDCCSWDLAAFRRSALARRRHDRLAHRPFNEIFVTAEHL